MIFNAVGVCQLYLTIFQSVLKTIVITIANADPEKGVGWFFNEGKFVIPIAGLILLPFAFQRSTDGLKWASWVAVGSCLLFIISIIVDLALNVIMVALIGVKLVGFGQQTHQIVQYSIIISRPPMELNVSVLMEKSIKLVLSLMPKLRIMVYIVKTEK